MNNIRAFVGHSFTEDDADLVAKFLKYFEQVQKSHSAFSWEHAEDAAPQDLATKVLSLIADKNTFIGICTKKERVIHPKSLLPVFLSSQFKKAREADFQWKTSDWIIQEIGLAIGRGLELVLLIEEGLRPPGGLQGNVEYITFDRAHPEKSFGKILEMIHALSPQASGMAASAPSDGSAAKQDEDKTNSSNKDWLQPSADWGYGNFASALLHFVLQNDEEGIARIGKAYLDTLDATEADKRTSWSATLEDYRISYGKNGNLNNLRKLVAINPNNAEVLSRMANAYASLEDFLQSARSYEAASACANTPKNADYYLGQAAIQYAKAKAFKESQALVEKLRTDAQDPERELSVLRTLWTLAELEKDDDAEVVVMERIVDISPDDFGTRFSLAYKHSEMGSNDLAFHHYLKIPYSERNETTWNNLGVSYKHFSMPAKSVLAYRKAEQMGETLAMANLGYLYMNAGFTEEAREQLDKALATDDPHKNVSLAYAALKDIPDAEEEKKKEVLQRAAPKTEFYRRCGRAIVEPEIRQIRPTWRGPKCDFQVTLRDGRFHATGKYEQDATNYLASAFGGPLKAVDRYEIEINGIVRGRLIEGTVKRTRNGKPPQGLLEIGSGETKALILLSGNDIDLDIMEGSNSLSPSFYSLHVI